MREVSCRFFAAPLRDVQSRQLDPQVLLAGTGCTLDQITDKDERVSWSDLERILRNGRAIWSDADLIRIGERSTEGPLVAFIGVVARIRFVMGAGRTRRDQQQTQRKERDGEAPRKRGRGRGQGRTRFGRSVCCRVAISPRVRTRPVWRWRRRSCRGIRCPARCLPRTLPSKRRW